MSENALTIDYGSRFDAAEIPDYETRDKVNSLFRKLSGIEQLSIVLEANAVERHTQGEGAEGLTSIQEAGLFAALVELSRDAYSQSEKLGTRLKTLTGKGGSNG